MNALNVYMRIYSYVLLNLLMEMDVDLYFVFTMYSVLASLAVLLPTLVATVIEYQMLLDKYNNW